MMRPCLHQQPVGDTAYGILHIANKEERETVAVWSISAEAKPRGWRFSRNSAITVMPIGLQLAQTSHIIGSLTTTRAEHLTLSLHTDGVAVSQADEFKPRGTEDAISLPTHIS